MSSKNIRLFSFIISAFLVLGIFEFLGILERRKYEQALEKIRLPALTALCEYSQAISVGLRTMAVSSDAALSDSAEFVREQSAGAIANLYCFEYEQVEGLSEYFKAVNAFAEASAENCSREKAIELSDHAEEVYRRTDKLLSGILNEKASVFETEDNFFGGSLDVPFEGQEAEYSDAEGGLIISSSIGKSDALKSLSKLFDIEPVLWREDKSEYPDGAFTYNYVYKNIRVRIFRANGMLYSLSSSLPCRERQLSQAQAEKIAIEFLNQQGIGNAVLTDSAVSEFTASLEYSPKNGDTVLLTSRIKIDVCLASGKISEYDASEYIQSYNPSYSAVNNNPELSAILPDGAYPIEEILCLKQIKGRNRLCYRVKCRFRGEHFFLYYDYYTLNNILTTD